MPKQTTTLTIAVRYDDEITHPEGLATALDRLLETALSTPGIMDDYGDVEWESAYVLGDMPDYETLEKIPMEMPMTWLPGLLAKVVEACAKKKVFNPGKLATYVRRAELSATQHTFRTADGYTLRLVKGVFTDGDLVFETDEEGWPVDSAGERLDGKWVENAEG